MTGGAGNDTYLVDNAGDVVVEQGGTPFTAPAGWTIKGTADLNNDGEHRRPGHQRNANQIWLLHNGAVLSTTDLPTPPSKAGATGRCWASSTPTATATRTCCTAITARPVRRFY